MNWKNKTHYELLQVSPSADENIIRAAYRAMISRYHPDRYVPKSEAEEISKALNLALAVLIDPEKRTAYDESIRSRDGSTPNSTSPETKTDNGEKNHSQTNLNWLYLIILFFAAFNAISFFAFIPTVIAAAPLKLLRNRLTAYAISIIAFLMSYLIFVAASQVITADKTTKYSLPSQVPPDLSTSSVAVPPIAIQAPAPAPAPLAQPAPVKELQASQVNEASLREEEFAFNAIKAGIETRAIEDGALVSSESFAFIIAGTPNGFRLDSKELGTVYLGKSCDALSRKDGVGYWYQPNAGLVVKLAKRELFFPRQGLDYSGCPDPTLAPSD